MNDRDNGMFFNVIFWCLKNNVWIFQWWVMYLFFYNFSSIGVFWDFLLYQFSFWASLKAVEHFGCVTGGFYCHVWLSHFFLRNLLCWLVTCFDLPPTIQSCKLKTSNVSTLTNANYFCVVNGIAYGLLDWHTLTGMFIRYTCSTAHEQKSLNQSHDCNSMHLGL